jgi:hypothetical protein
VTVCWDEGVASDVGGIHCLHPVRSTFYVVQAASEKFGLRMGNMKFTARNEELISIRKSMCVLYLCICLYLMCSNKYTDKNRNSL